MVPGRYGLEPHPNEGRRLKKPCPAIVVTDGNVTEVRLVLE